jgi:hypothetical protein
VRFHFPGPDLADDLGLTSEPVEAK